MASLSLADVPVHASGRGRSYRSVQQSGSGSPPPREAHIDGIDPEKADILGPNDVDDIDLDHHRSESWDDGVPQKSSASVWRTYVCKYRYVIAGVAVLILASMFAGIAIGARGNKGAAAPAGATTVASSQEGGGDAKDKGLDVPDVLPPDEPETKPEPEAEPEEPKPAKPEDQKPQDKDKDEGEGKGEDGGESKRGNDRSDDDVGAQGSDDKGRSKDDDKAKRGGDKDNKRTGDQDNDNNKKDSTLPFTGGAGAGAVKHDSLSYSDRRRRRYLGAMNRAKPAKKNRHSAMRAVPPEKQYRGGRLE